MIANIIMWAIGLNQATKGWVGALVVGLALGAIVSVVYGAGA